MRNSTLLALSSVLALSTGLYAADYYISNGGNDNSSGTQASPWKTISKVNNTTFNPGDCILFQGGQTFSGKLYLDANDTGTAASPITVSSYGTGRATIDAGTGAGIFVYNTAGIVISNVQIVGGWDSATQSGSTDSGIGFYVDLGGTKKLNYVRVDNVEVRGFMKAGMFFGAWPADGTKSGFTDVQVTNCVVHDNGGDGIMFYGYFKTAATTYAHQNIVVRNCTVYNQRGIAAKTDGSSGSGIVLGDVEGALIERCLAYNNGEFCNHPGAGPVGIWCWDSRNVTIQFNESYGNKTGNSSVDGGGFDLDGGVTNSLCQYNYSHDNAGAGFFVYQFSNARPALSGNTVRYNVSQNDGRKHAHGGIHMGGGSAVKNNEIYNNTVYMAPTTTGAAIKVTGVGTGNHIRNNIVQTSGGVMLVHASTAFPTTSLLFQGNMYYAGTNAADFKINWGGTVHTSLAAWRATGQELNGAASTGLEVNPLLTSPGGGTAIGNPDLLPTLAAYQLAGGSPCIDSGLNLQALFAVNPGSRDYYGNTIQAGAGFDIGAYEFVLRSGKVRDFDGDRKADLLLRDPSSGEVRLLLMK